MRGVVIFVVLAIVALMFGSVVTAYAADTARNLGLPQVAEHVGSGLGQGLIGLAAFGFGLAAIVGLVKTG